VELTALNKGDIVTREEDACRERKRRRGRGRQGKTGEGRGKIGRGKEGKGVDGTTCVSLNFP